MSSPTLVQAINNIYASIKAGNQDLDACIAVLKTVMMREGKDEVIFDPSRLAQPNRQGRKFMQSYFKKKGVTVAFGE